MDRLFTATGRCFDVAIDHGIVNEATHLGGIQNMRATLATIVGAAPDVIQLTPGTAPLLHTFTGRPRPALALRADVSNVYGPTVPSHTFSHLMDHALDAALRLDAACVVANLLLLPNQPELHHQCVANIATLRHRCEQVGMPLMIEPLVMAPNERAGGYMVDGDLALITALVRQAAELGADIIKADPCTDPQDFHKIVEVAGPIPVLVRGGGRVRDDELLARTAEIMSQGASGIVYGRNVIHHAHPDRMINALLAIVHHDVSPDAAADLLAGAAGRNGPNMAGIQSHLSPQLPRPAVRANRRDHNPTAAPAAAVPIAQEEGTP